MSLDDLGFDTDLQQAALRVERRGTRAVATTTPPPDVESERGKGAYRPATTRRTATVRKTLRLDADLVQRFESREASGGAPPLTRLVERWLRDYLDDGDSSGQPGPS